MTLSEYIKTLQGLEKTGYGDLKVMRYQAGELREITSLPLPKHLKKKSPRESKTRVWEPFYGEELKGELVLI